MAFFAYNQQVFGGSGSHDPDAFFLLKERLKTIGGWVHKGSGDGLSLVSTTLGNANDVITHMGSGANGFNNQRAWIHLQESGGGREFILQRGTGGSGTLNWRGKYSQAAGFTGRSPTFQTTASATDEGFFWGGGTDASPTFTSNVFQNLTNNAASVVIVAEDVTPFRFYMIWGAAGSSLTASGNTHPYHIFAFDYAEPDLVTDDPDPTIIWARGIANVISEEIGSGPATAYGWVGVTSFQAQHTYGFSKPTTTTLWAVPPGSNASEADGFPLLPVLVGRDTQKATPNAMKGLSSLFRLTIKNFSDGTLLDAGSARSHATFGWLAGIWDGATDLEW